ncbi:CocE/NonD hydrolase [Penicillium nucicola]|uniref:CocE/NonD hydrolase n=1 Tax=Penicillium nucicola TaxID=1850975 RepID=UPI0025455E7D|nr:CocE/NonD hydrolase [Penicillium nucicola]KAJ5758355.1 CocE/NonD hydrolase [Penicillium nucicola]
MTLQRGLSTTILDRLVARWLGFPPELCSYTLTSVRIPVSNGSEPIELAASLYQPVLAKGQTLASTILIRCPYGRGTVFTVLSARPYASRGYQCLFVSCRGTFGSGGRFDPWCNEEEDGQAVVEWMRKQDWYTGSFATLGSSYLGYVQWALLRDPPSDMVAAVIQCAPHDFSQQLWGTGSLALEWITWGENILHQEESGLFPTLKKLNTPNRMRTILDRIPLATSVKDHFHGRAPWLESVVDADASNPYHEQMKFGEALERADIPILLVGGWYDVFATQTIQQYMRLAERNTKVALLMGPWNHMQVGQASRVYQQSFSWLEEHLAKRTQRTLSRNMAVQFFVTGAQEWREVPKWPPPTIAQELYLQSGRRLDAKKPSARTSSMFTFDPKQPTPTIGGNLLLGGGSVDDTVLGSRSDALVFTTEALEQDLEISGKIAVVLSYTSDAPKVDLFVRISEVDDKERSHCIAETYKRLHSTGEDDPIILLLNDCAHRFLKGKRVKLIITGASHPQFAMNIGEDLHTVAYTIFQGGKGASRVILPVGSL